MPKTRISSSIILTRGSKQSPEVYLVKRSPKLRFFGGYWAFPGGNIDDVDYHSPDDPVELALKRCAIRELLEELDILSATLGKQLSDTDKQKYKDILENEPKKWQVLVEGADRNIDIVCKFITPPFVPVRYETLFMHVEIPEYEPPVIDNQELIDGRYFRPQDAVDAWEKGEMEIAPPVLLLLRLLAQHDLDSFKDVALETTRRFENGALHPVYFSPGIFMASLHTPTLPPATTTNTFIVGTQELYIIDPATPDKDEQQRLFNKMDELITEGKEFKAILLTHHHIDHVGAVEATSQRYQLPVRAHPLCYEKIDGSFFSREPINDGETVTLGTSPSGKTGWQLKAVHTPGHAVDHLCYFENCYNAAIVGDMLSTVSTILIDPPEGHMRTYLDSLGKLLNQPMKTLHPAHGPGHRDGHALIRHYLKHRKEREQAIIDSLSDNARSIEEILPVVYDDVPEKALPVASRSLLAGLIKLEEDGVCKNTDSGWVRN